MTRTVTHSPQRPWREQRQIEVLAVDFQLNLGSETVEQISSAQPVCVEPDCSVRDVLHRMKANRRGAVLICREGRLDGIFTERDALKLMAAGADFDVPVEQVMTAHPESLADNDTVGAAIAKMSHGSYRRMPIVDADGRPKGFVKVSGILHFLVAHFPSIVYNLPPNPHHSTQSREGA